MKKYCAICRKLVDIGHVCSGGRKRQSAARSVRNTAKWQRIREEIKRRDGGVDQIAINGLAGTPYIETRNLEVHHIEPLEERPDLAFESANLITVSRRTHEMAEKGIIPRKKLHEIARMNDAKGDGIEECGDVTVISGAPKSGKGDYVKAHKGDRDLVWDRNAINDALMGGEKDHRPVEGVTLKIENEVYETVAAHEGGWEHAWIITEEPNPSLVKDLCRRLKAGHIHIDSTPKECIERIQKDKTIPDKEQRIARVQSWHKTASLLGGFTEEVDSG